jgi:hypothetical protein
MWRTSELDLRRQLSQALKTKDELSAVLSTGGVSGERSRTDTPAGMLVMEFDQVKL